MASNRFLTLTYASAFGLTLSACQGEIVQNGNTASAVTENRSVPVQNSSAQKAAAENSNLQEQAKLPVYDGVTALEASIDGRLSIVGGCVYLIGADGSKAIIIFPKASSFSADRRSINSLNKTATDGDQVQFSGAPTTRTFWKSFAPGTTYHPIADSCAGDSVWLAGQMTKQ
jgi:uncharacterized protein (DUF2126 family)